MKLARIYSKLRRLAFGDPTPAPGEEYVDLVTKQQLRVLSVGNNIQLGHLDGNGVVEKETSTPRWVFELAVRKEVVVPKDEYRP